MKKLLLILLCLPVLFTTCKKEDTNTSINNTGNNGCWNDKYISFDVLGTSYFDDFDGTTQSKDGSYHYCQDDNGGMEPISAKYADIIYNNDGTKDLSLDFYEFLTSRVNFQLVIKDIDNISTNTQYSISKYESNTTVALDHNWGVNFGSGYCTFRNDCIGEISFTSIDLVNNIFTGTFWLTAWEIGQDPQQCSDTIYISNGIFHDIDEGVYQKNSYRIKQ